MNQFSEDVDEIAAEVLGTSTSSRTPDSPPSSKNSHQTLVLASQELTVEAHLNGRTRIPIIVSQGGVPLLVDTVEIASVTARGKLNAQLPEGVRQEAAELLERAAADVIRATSVEEPQPDPIGQGRMQLFADPEPWPSSVEGADLLNGIAGTYRRFVVLPEGGAEALALFVLLTYTHEAAQILPLVALVSPEKGCGKTTALSVTRELAHRALPASNVSPAAVFRSIEKYTPTFIVDEADSFLSESNELRGILNSGHTRGTAQVIRCAPDTHEPRIFSTWCPKVLATIGRLADTLMDRAIVISMRRRLSSEHVDYLRLDRLHGELEPLRRKAQRWALDYLDAIGKADPLIPPDFHNRAADNWRPLFAIADLAGGDWPELARWAARVLSSVGEDDSHSIQMLADLRTSFSSRHWCIRLASADLVIDLVQMIERPWPEWRNGRPITQQQVAKLLKPFDIKPKMMRIGPEFLNGAWNEPRRGYALDDCKDAFARYLPPLSSEAEHSCSEKEPKPSSSVEHSSVTPHEESAKSPELSDEEDGFGF